MDDKPKDWVDFAKAKAVRFEVALEALGVLGSLRRDGEQLQGVCPLHKASGDKESFGVHLGKQTFNCFACKKHGKVLDFVMQVKGIGAKDAAVWPLSLVDKREVQERIQAEAVAGNGGSVAGSGAAVVQEAAQQVAATSLPAIEGLTGREAWLVAVIAQGVAWYLAQRPTALAGVSDPGSPAVAEDGGAVRRRTRFKFRPTIMASFHATSIPAIATFALRAYGVDY